MIGDESVLVMYVGKNLDLIVIFIGGTLLIWKLSVISLIIHHGARNFATYEASSEPGM
jgi:hypothetical protein